MIAESGRKVGVELIRALYRFKPLREYRVESRKSDSFVYYVSGGHLFDFGTETIVAKAGQLLYLPLGAAYTNHTLTEDTEYYQLEFTLWRDGAAKPLFEKGWVLPELESGAYLPVMREIYEQYALDGVSGDYIAAAGTLKMIGLLTKEKKDNELKTLGLSRVEKTVSYLDEFYYLDTPVSELAEMSATCVSNLEKVFKSCLGMTPLAYRNKLRMERAKMLLSGGVPIAQSCRAVGIPDVYYFSKLFKRYCGISPGEYAKTNKTV